jgi:hypothetical protein
MLHIISIIPLDTHFFATFASIYEKEDDFIWALQAYREVVGKGTPFWLTDLQLALKCAILATYPEGWQMLCL